MDWRYIKQVAADFAAAHSTAIAAFLVGVVIGAVLF
jgi:hypothetical protein